MKKLLLIFGAFFLPIVSLAVDPLTLLGGTGDGLVPSRGIEGYFYRACDLITLSNNVINFGVAFSVIVATLMFAYAGILYVTAAGAGTEQIKKAHKVFTNVFVGLLLVLLAWLIVNILFSVLSGRGLAEWSQIDCIDNPTTAAFEGVADRSVGGIVVGPGGTGGTGGTYPPSGGRCSPITSGPCSPANLTRYFGQTNASNMSAICREESTGNSNAAGDIGWYEEKEPFSYGLFQINLTSTIISCPGHGTLDCPSAFGPVIKAGEKRLVRYGGRPTTLRAESGWGRPIKDRNLYNKCKAAATDFACNLTIASKKFSDADRAGSGYQPWVTSAGKCGLL